MFQFNQFNQFKNGDRRKNRNIEAPQINDQYKTGLHSTMQGGSKKGWRMKTNRFFHFQNINEGFIPQHPGVLQGTTFASEVIVGEPQLGFQPSGSTFHLFPGPQFSFHIVKISPCRAHCCFSRSHSRHKGKLCRLHRNKCLSIILNAMPM